MIEQFEEFVGKELTRMGNKIEASLEENLENRQYNPFHGFTHKDMEKYMALGRSFDSQLDNRLQRISMYLARGKYGYMNVPNYVFIAGDRERERIDMWSLAISGE